MAGCAESVEPGGREDSSEIVVIRNGIVISATGLEPVRNGLVAAEGDRLIYVGEEEGYSIPSGALVYDADGGTILPGFIDAHTHSTSDPAVRREFLVGGVTTVCDLGSALSQMPLFDIEIVGEDPVARGFRAGPILTAPGGLPGAALGGGLNYEVATPEEGRAAVEDLHQRGASLIKVYLQEEVGGVSFPMLDEATLAAIVEKAHAMGLPVRAHVTYTALLKMAVAAGVDSIEHVPINSTQAELVSGFEDPTQLTFDEAAREYEVQLQKMVEAGTRHSAAACGQGDELGTLEMGKLADVIVVDGNPLEDITLMDRVTLVVKDGIVSFISDEMLEINE